MLKSKILMKIFDYDDVQLIPVKCVVKSRSDCETSIKYGKLTFKMPVVPSNMVSVVNEELCIKLAKEGYFYIMHRFNVDVLAFCKLMKKNNLFISVSIGVKKEDHLLIEKLKKNNIVPDYITIDIAHGHSNMMKSIIYKIKDTFGDKTFVIAGNVATPDAVRDLERWGADSIKVGVGPGKVCTTKIKTGFGTGGWQLSAVNWCRKSATIPIVADGGIRVHGDIAKSIRFGATMVMIGSLFASHIESPGKKVIKDNIVYKEYFGSASEFNKKEKRYIEGKKQTIKLRGSIFNTLKTMKEDLQSSVSYAGGTSLNSIRKVNYVILKDSDYF